MLDEFKPASIAVMGRRGRSRRERAQALGKMEVFAITKQQRIPGAPMRDVGEVMHDPHMLETLVVAQILAAHRPADDAGTRRNSARLPTGVKKRGEGSIGGFLHRDFDQPALSRALALEQRRRYRGIEGMPDRKSTIAGPALTGGPPSSPVVLIRPETW
jgi:hypothetical protein